jgi:uncharacterized protein (TIGR03083 family)
MMDDQELVDALDEVWSSIGDVGDGLSESEWKAPTEVPGWSVQDNLSHIVGMEARLLGRDEPAHDVPADLPHVRNEVGAGNEVAVDARRARSGAEVLAEFRDVTGERLAQLRAAGPDDFGAESWTPVGPGTVRDLLPFRIFDSWVHEQDMRRAVGREGHLDGPVAEAALERTIGAVPFVVGKKAAAPDGSTVVVELSGPLARSFGVGVEGGRARLLDDVPASPTTRIVTDSPTFERLGTGRVDPATALRDGRVTVEGDDALGQKVVTNLNFLF